jgi:hypothetical protein
MPDAYDRLESPSEPGPALRALPLLAPRESALPGLLAELAARRRRRALGWLVPAAAAALMVLAIVPRQAAPPDPGRVDATAATTAATTEGSELARLMRANAVLEQRLASVRAAHIAQDGDAAQASAQIEDMVVLVDTALGANPPEDRRRMLWQRRLELLQALCQVQREGSFAPDQADNGRTYLASF